MNYKNFVKYTFIVHLTMRSVLQILLQHQMTEQSVSKESERMWKEAVMAQFKVMS
jgi:hypothetical protein